MAQSPWIGPDDEPIRASRLDRLDMAIIAVAYAQDILLATVATVERIKYGLMGHYNNRVAADEITEMIEIEWEEEDSDG